MGKNFFLIKISTRFSPFLVVWLQSAGQAPPSSDDNGPGAGRTQQKRMCYPAPYAHAGAGRLTGIREQICKKEVERMLQCIIRKLRQKILVKKSLRNYSTSAFHKYLYILVKKNIHQCFLCKCTKISKQSTSQLLSGWRSSVQVPWYLHLAQRQLQTECLDCTCSCWTLTWSGMFIQIDD